jgi:hypothetical protein
MTIVFLYNIGSLLLKANIWQMLGVLAYMFSTAFFESFFLFGILILLSIMLPRRIFGERFVYLGTSLALIITGMVLIINTPIILEMTWIMPLLAGIFLIYIIYILLLPADKIQKSALAERLTVISSIYVFIDIICIIYIIFRQII